MFTKILWVVHYWVRIAATFNCDLFWSWKF